MEGQLTEADHLAGRALASTASMGLAGHPIMVEALCAQGRIAFERDDLAAAEILRSRRIGTYKQAVLDRLENHLPPKAYRGEAGPLSDRELTVVLPRLAPDRAGDFRGDLRVDHTVKTHVKRIYQKLGVSSRTEAVAEAGRLGVL